MRLVVLALAALAALAGLWILLQAPVDPPLAVAPARDSLAALEVEVAAPPPSAPSMAPSASLLSTLLTGSEPHASTVQLAVVVAGPDGRALGGASVFLAGRRAGVSDARGRFEVCFPRLIDAEPELELAVEAAGCAPWQRRVRVAQGTAHARAQLAPKGSAERGD